ncbi:hypothetical protein Bca4012_093710 [Brassica carinata]|uniref:Uncharacterized protein n=2 Tax=Brassica TaxID=3705 RepID=A0A8X7PS18_BRACI|nr:UPF0725 protein EMB2204-like [Brassica napus]XP_048622228.1 UPF0725 protein EMB2204-like [Brassica napus]KAG2256595.1 hypothetical protein Bca52824_075889 [Brassica carinata]CAF2107709.1 unnamed protein product [Brassica napus]
MEELDFFKSPDEFPPRRGGYGLVHVDCVGKRGYTNSALVNLYAKLGLHRYNWLEGTNFELDSIMKFNMRGAASPYYITLVACLPSSGLQQIFQVLVEEERLGILDLTCPISRPQGTESSKKESTPFLRPHSEPVSATHQDRLLGWTKSVIPWPSSEIGFSDTKRFYMLNESELQCDWISLYVELAICTSHRWFKARDLSNFELEIVQVAIESLHDKEPPSLKSKAAVIYIAYKDLAKARTGEPYHYQVVVRRVINEATGTLSIQGDCWIAAAATASGLRSSPTS